MNLEFNHEAEGRHEAIGCSEEQMKALVKKLSRGAIKKSDTYTLEVWEQCIALTFLLESGNGFELAVLSKMFGFDIVTVNFSKAVEFFYNNPEAREFMCDVLKEFDKIDPSRNGEGTACDEAEEKARPHCEEDVYEECPACEDVAEVVS